MSSPTPCTSSSDPRPAPQAPASPTDGSTELRVLLILSALMSFASISTDFYLPALPTLGAELHASPGQPALTISTFLAGFSLGQLFWGPISDRYGRRLPVALGMLLFVIGSLGCAMCHTIGEMMGWRVVQALGACAGPVLARAMVRDLYTREQAARMLSVLILMMGAAPLLGPLLGGQILLLWSWRGIFWTLVLCGVLSLISLHFLPETLPPQRRAAESVRATLSAYGGLLRAPGLWRYALTGGFFYAGVYAFVAGTPFAYIDYYHVSPQAYGLLFAVNIVGMMLANFINARLLRKRPSEGLFQASTWFVAIAGLLQIASALSGFGGLVGLAIPAFLFMSMNGFIVANSLAGALAAYPQRAGAVSSLVGTLQFGSGVLSAAILGWWGDGTPRPMAWITAIAGLGCLLAARLPNDAEDRPPQARGQAAQATGKP